MSSFLERILPGRTRVVEALRPRLGELEERARSVPPSRDFAGALRKPGMSIIAEIKRKSPSKGELDPGLDPADLARTYERGGANAISVLTEPDFFAGSAEDLVSAREATRLPVLWKDFILDRAQIVEACATGADAVLVIVRIAERNLDELMDEARRWGLTALVEVFNEDDVERALGAGADVIGVNHRDLQTFEEDPSATARLRPMIPKGSWWSARARSLLVKTCKRLRTSASTRSSWGKPWFVPTIPQPRSASCSADDDLRCARDLDKGGRDDAAGRCDSRRRSRCVGGRDDLRAFSRRVTLEAAKEIRDVIPEEVMAFGVFDDSAPREVGEVAELLNLNGVQFPAPLVAGRFLPSGVAVLRTVRVRTAEDLAEVERLECDALHLDSYVEGKLGGTGQVAPWDVIEANRPRSISSYPAD